MALAFGVFLISCGGGYSSGEEASNEEAGDSDVSTSIKTSVGVFHRVSDVDSWNAAYNELSDSEARIVVLTSNDDPNLLAVFEWTEGHEAAKAFYGSDDFKNMTDSVGVEGEMDIVYYDVQAVDDQPALTYVLAASHEVEDYDAWKVKFDEDSDARSNAGIKFEALATDADNPNMVYLMFSTNDLDAAMEMFESDDLKQKMEDAGVKGEPVMSVWLSPIGEEDDDAGEGGDGDDDAGESGGEEDNDG